MQLHIKNKLFVNLYVITYNYHHVWVNLYHA
jgi:hypothetical protein